MPDTAPTPGLTAGLTPGPDLPHGRTAQRLQWKFLPPDVRILVERRLGGPVVHADSQDAGFTPGFASVLTTADGSRTFVKAASRQAQRPVAASYAEEARKAALLGPRVPAPVLRWVHEDDAWVVLGYDAVDGRAPKRPWRRRDLERALALATEIADVTREVPEGLGLARLVEDLPTLVTGWDSVPADWPHRTEAAALARAFADLPADRFVHADLRDDNILLTSDGALACDWNWPALAPAWVDAVTLLVSAHGDGLDAEELLAGCPLTRDVAADEVDAWLAALCGFMREAGTRPAPSTSPHLRAHTDFYARAAWSWLSRRRGWEGR